MTGNSTAHPLAYTLSLGFLGGTALLLTQAYITRGPAILITFAAILFVAGACVRSMQVSAFWRRFTLLLAPIATACVSAYVAFAALSPSIGGVSVLGHLWRIGLVLAISAVASFTVAPLATPYVAGNSDHIGTLSA